MSIASLLEEKKLLRKRYKDSQKKYSKSKVEIPAGLYDKCNKCGEMLLIEDIISNSFTCDKCGHQFRMRAVDRIKITVDEGTFSEKGFGFITLNPLDIENDFPDRLIPSDFVFYYNISMPEHITLTIGNSQVHVFLEKVRGKARERNKIFQIHNKFLMQNKAIREKENDIKELEDKIQSIHDQYREEYCQWRTTTKELEEKIKKLDEIITEIDKIFAVPEFRRYHELIEDYIKSKYTKKESENMHKPLWNKLQRYKETHIKIIKPMGEREDALFKEKNSIGNYFDLTKKLEELPSEIQRDLQNLVDRIRTCDGSEEQSKLFEESLPVKIKILTRQSLKSNNPGLRTLLRLSAGQALTDVAKTFLMRC